MDTKNRYIISIVVILAIIGYLLFKQKMNTRLNITTDARYHIRHIIVSFIIIVSINYFVHQNDEMPQVTQMTEIPEMPQVTQNGNVSVVSVSKPVIDKPIIDDNKYEDNIMIQTRPEIVAPKVAPKVAPRAETLVAPKITQLVAPKAETVVAPRAETLVVPKITQLVAPKAETIIAPKAETIIAPKVETTSTLLKKGMLKSITNASSIILPDTVLKNGDKILSKSGITEVGIIDEYDIYAQDTISQFYFKNKNNKRTCCGEICAFKLPKITEEECKLPITENNYVYRNDQINSIDTVTLYNDKIVIKSVNGKTRIDPINESYFFKKSFIEEYPNLINQNINDIIKFYDINGNFVKEIKQDSKLTYNMEHINSFGYILVRDEGIFLFNSNDELLAIH
jgi:hypothetical protein